MFTERMTASPTISWHRVRDAADKLTTPLHPDDYLRLLNPLWSQRELRGRIEEVVPAQEILAAVGKRWRAAPATSAWTGAATGRRARGSRCPPGPGPAGRPMWISRTARAMTR